MIKLILNILFFCTVGWCFSQHPYHQQIISSKLKFVENEEEAYNLFSKIKKEYPITVMNLTFELNLYLAQKRLKKNDLKSVMYRLGRVKYPWGIIMSELKIKKDSAIVNSYRNYYDKGLHHFEKESDKASIMMIDKLIYLDQHSKKLIREVSADCFDIDGFNEKIEVENYKSLKTLFHDYGFPSFYSVGYQRMMQLRVLLLHASRHSNQIHNEIKSLYEQKVDALEIPPGFLTNIIDDKFEDENGYSLFGKVVKDQDVVREKIDSIRKAKGHFDMSDLNPHELPAHFLPIQNCEKTNEARRKYNLPTLEQCEILFDMSKPIECLNE